MNSIVACILSFTCLTPARSLAEDDLRKKYIAERRKLTDYDIEVAANIEERNSANDKAIASETIKIRFVKLKEKILQFVEHKDELTKKLISDRVIGIGCIDQPMLIV